MTNVATCLISAILIRRSYHSWSRSLEIEIETKQELLELRSTSERLNVCVTCWRGW